LLRLTRVSLKRRERESVPASFLVLESAVRLIANAAGGVSLTSSRMRISGGCGFRVSLILEQRAKLLTKCVGLWMSVDRNRVENCQIEYFLFGA
jgi:hypothetical protein